MPQQRVDIPGVGIVEFPEGMSRAEINAAAERLYNESQGPMTWPPGEPTGREIEPPGPGLATRVGRALQEPGRESIISPSPGLTPVERANLRAAQTRQRIPYEKPVPGLPGQPTQEEMQQMAFEPLVHLSPTAERWWPHYEGIALPEQAERGFALGMSRLIEGFTSPASLITIGAAGGIGALSNTMRVLISMGFSGLLAADAIIQAPEIVDHVREGRYDEAVATGTEVLGKGGLGVMAGAHAVKAGPTLPWVTGRAMIPSPRRGPGLVEPRVYGETAPLEVLPAHEPLFPGRAAELPGTPARGYLPEIPRRPARGVPAAVSTEGLYMGGRPAEPGVRGLLPEAPGVDVVGAGAGRRLRGGARVGPPEAPAAEPIVRGEQTVTPTGRPRGLFGDEPSNVLRRQRMAPDFVGPRQEAIVAPEGPRLLPPAPGVELPPGGGPLVTEVRPGEPGGLGPFRQADIVPTGRPGAPARVREPGRFRVREEGDPSSDLLRDEPMVELEGPPRPQVPRAEPPVEAELTFEEAEAAGKVKVVRPPKTRRQIGAEWYKENSLERMVSDEGGLKLDLTLEEHIRMLMPNLGARRTDRSYSMFDPIRARKGEGGMTPDQMFEVLKDRLPKGWTQKDFEAALTDRTPGTGGQFPFEAEVDIFDRIEAQAEARTPPEFRPEVPERVTPEVPARAELAPRELGEPPRTVEEAEAIWERNRQDIAKLRTTAKPDPRIDQLHRENDLQRQQNITRIRQLEAEAEPIEPKVEPEGARERLARQQEEAEAELAREAELPERAERVAAEGQEIVVESATEAGFDPADGEWGVFRRDPTGRKALLRQFEDLGEADRWAEQYRVPMAERPAREEFPERVGLVEEPPAVREPDIERIRREGAGVEPLPPGWEIKRTQAGDWGAYFEGNLQLRKRTRGVVEQFARAMAREEAAEPVRGLEPAEPTVRPEGLQKVSVGDRVAFERADAPGTFEQGRVESIYSDGRRARIQRDRGGFADVAIRELTAPERRPEAPVEPPEPEVTPEGQVEIVGHEGFLRESRLADDKAALERLLTARPDPTTEAGKQQIIELGRRERELRASIARQERELRGEPEQVGMFREDEPPLFEREPRPTPEAELPPEPARPPSRAQSYVDTLVRDPNIEPEVAAYGQAYLDWKLGGQTEPAPRMPGTAARGFRQEIDRIVDAESGTEPAGPGGQSTLYMNPIQPALEWWSKRAGPRIWKYIASTKQPYGILVKPWPEPMKWLFINRHRQPATWVERHKEWERRTEQGALDAFELGKETTHKLSQEDQQLLGRLLKGEASEKELRAMRENLEWWRAIDAIKTARSKFDEYGALAAEQKLLQQETFFKNYGKYMPRLYRRWEVDYDAQLRRWGARKPTRLDLDRFRARQDIPEEVRMMMGEILEPGYPIAKGLAQLIHDVETSKLFNFVNNNEAWTFEPETLFSLGKDPKQYTLMPTTDRLGPLSGKYVDKYIASELNQMVKARGEMEKVSKRLVSEWKFNKVIFNPATHGRNMVSNTMLAYLAGLPPWRVDIYARAIKELWRQEGEYYQAAKDAGLFTTTFAKGELAPLMDSWNSANGGIYDRIAGMQQSMSEGKVAEGLGKVLPSGTRAGQRAARIYQAEEAWFKLAKFIQESENGATPKQAAAAAQKALFDYTEVPPFVKWARTSPIGAPFLTFTYKALPQILETGITHPWRLGSLVYGIYALEEAARKHLEIDEDQMEYLKRIAPDRMKGEPLGLGPKALLLPYVDKYDQLQYLDLTYILPWGDIGETGSTGVYQGSPIHAGPMRAIYEISINKSAFTGEEIYGENDSKKVVAQKISDHLYKWAMPSLAPPIPGVTEGGYGFERIWKSVWGQEDYFGRVSAPTTAIASAIIGLKTNPLNPDIELFFRVEEFEDGMDEINAAAYKVQNHQGLSEEEKITQLDELRERARVLEEIYREMLYGQEPVIQQPAAPGQPQGEPQVQPER